MKTKNNKKKTKKKYMGGSTGIQIEESFVPTVDNEIIDLLINFKNELLNSTNKRMKNYCKIIKSNFFQTFLNIDFNNLEIGRAHV